MTRLHQEERRLRAAFRIALAAALAACQGSEVAPQDAGDASLAPDASAPAPPDACAPSPTDGDAGQLDGGPPIFLPDGGPCESFFLLSCGLPEGTAPPRASCYLSYNDCTELCGFEAYACRTVPPGGQIDCEGDPPPDGAVVIECHYCLTASGRRPPGLLAPARAHREASALGAYFARSAHLEAASVAAFERLARELRAHGAPRALVRAARAAAGDERRHARAMARLAREHGARPERPRLRPASARALADLARDNAVEGCVRETFGALLAAFQARRARDGRVAAALREIARDELRHAALAWEIARWADAALDPGARIELREAQRRARAELEREIAADPPATLRDGAGLPPAEVQRAMLASLARELRMCEGPIHPIT